MDIAFQIDIIIPVLNPPLGWAELTFQRKTELETLIQMRVNLIISNDGSNKKEELEKLQKIDPTIVLINSKKNRGKGNALRAGFEKSKAHIALFTDADFPYEMASMKAMIEALQSGSDVVLGYREDDYYASVPWFRKGLSEAFRFVLKSILKFPITDTQCGLKGMSAKGKAVFLQTKIDRFLVDMEFIKLAVHQSDIAIKPVVVKLRPNVEFSSMGMGVLLRELWNFVRVVFK